MCRSDPFSTRRVAADLAGFLETREVDPVVGVGHFIPMQRPEETIRLIKDFRPAGDQDPP